MKNKRLTGLYMRLKFVALAMVLLSTIPVRGTDRIIFLNSGGDDYWGKDNACFTIHYWQNGVAENTGDVTMTATGSNNQYYAFIPSWADRVIFARRASDKCSEYGLSEGDYYNKTGDLTLENYYGQWNISSWESQSWANTVWWNNYTVYYDDTETGFTSGASTPKLRVGTESNTTKDDMTLVPGTKSLYKHTKSGGNWDAYHAFCFANAAGATGEYSIYNRGSDQYLITKQTEYIRGSLMGNFTIIGRSSGSYQGEGTDASCTYYPAEIYYGIKKYTITNTSVDHATVELYYWDENNAKQIVTEGNSAQVLPTTKVWCKVTPDEGYVVSKVMLSDPDEREWTDASNDASGRNLYVVRTDVTFTAVIEELVTKTILIKDVNSWAPNMYFKGWNPFLYDGYDNADYYITTQKVGDKVTICDADYYIVTFTNELPFYYIHNEGGGTRTAFFKPSKLNHMAKYDNTMAGDEDWGLKTADCSSDIYWVESTIGGKTYFSNIIASTDDTLSFYAANSGTVAFHKSAETGVDVTTSVTSFFGSGQPLDGKTGGVFTATPNSGETGITNVAVYDGDYHIHVNATTRNYLTAGVGKDGTIGTKFTYFEPNAIFGDVYDYYWVDWFLGTADSYSSQSVVATVGNTYNANLAGVLGADSYAPYGMTQAAGGNVRYGYNPETNYFERAIVAAGNAAVQITSLGADSIKVSTDGGSTYTDDATTARYFSDATNWNYQVYAQVKGTAHANVTTSYVSGTQTLANTKKLIEGDNAQTYDVIIVYDFKTNRVIAAWTPSGAFTGFDLQSNLMAVRTENGSPTVLNMNRADVDQRKATLTNITKVYTVLEITQDNWKKSGGNADRRIVTGNYTDEYYWISLPYDCYIGDIFGIEGYGTSWVMQTYHGDYRAQRGWWAETGSWWYNMDRTDTLKAHQGYVVRLTNLNGENSTSTGIPKRFAGESGGKLYLYFPSLATGLEMGLLLDGDALATATTTTPPTHECLQWHRNADESNAGNPTYDRRTIDSNWNLIGSPSFNTAKITDGSWSTAAYPTTNVTGTLKYFYTWSVSSGTPVYTAVSATGIEFKASHAYLVQYGGTINWQNYDASNPLVAIKGAPVRGEEEADETFTLVLRSGDQQVDVTYITRMAEGATEGYDLNQDLSKLMNKRCDNLYTLAGYYKMAGNCLPDSINIVPVGVEIAHAGEFTFAMPEVASGIGATLIDNSTGARTNLALGDYSVALEAGTYEDRFTLELSAYRGISTGVDRINNEEPSTTAAKRMVDGVMYILRDGVVYDAQGTRVK